MKLSAYRMYITSVVLHGYEGWFLGEKECKMLNGFDLRAQMTMTGWDYDVVAATRVFVLVDYVRKRRVKNLGHTLRLDPDHMAYKVLEGYYSHLVKMSLLARPCLKGTIFENAPKHQNFDELVSFANDKSSWSKHASSLVQSRRASRRSSGGRVLEIDVAAAQLEATGRR